MFKNKKHSLSFKECLGWLVFGILFGSIIWTGSARALDDGNTKPASRIIRHVVDREYSILEDRDTGVCYLEFEDSSSLGKPYGLVFMVNPDGTPKIWDD